MRAVLSMPSGDGPFPVVVTIHGGQGNRDLAFIRTLAVPGGISQTVTMLNEQPWAVLAISYRAGGGAVLGMEQDDVVAGIRFAKTLPRIDPARVGVLGGSQGGHLALRAAEVMGREILCVAAGSPWMTNPRVYLFGKPDQPPLSEISAQARAVVLSTRATVLRGLLRNRGLSAEALDTLLAERSIEEHAAQIVVPALFLTSLADEQVPHVMVEPTIARLKTAGRDVTVYTAIKSLHGFYWGRDVGGSRVGRGAKTPEELAEEAAARSQILRFFTRCFGTAWPVTRLRAGEHTRTISVGTLQRRYQVHVPKKYADTDPTPVIVVFHGGGGNPAGMVRLTGLNAKSEQSGFIVVYPFGSGLDPGRGLTFNGGGCCGYALQNKRDDVGFTRTLLDDLASVANVDTNRVFATGLSNGGIMAYYLASELSDRIAAIAPVGGPMMTETCHPTRPVSVMHFHGTADEFAPFRGGFGKGFLRRNGVTRFNSVEHSIRNWVKANGCKAEPEVVAFPDKADDGMKVTRKAWGSCKDDSEVVQIEIEGGGHTWPGMDPPLVMLGKSTKDISANDLMWEFFQQHPMKPAAAPKWQPTDTP